MEKTWSEEILKELSETLWKILKKCWMKSGTSAKKYVFFMMTYTQLSLTSYFQPSTFSLQTIHKYLGLHPNKLVCSAFILSISANKWISECTTYFGCFIVDLPCHSQTKIYCMSLLFTECTYMHYQSGDAPLPLYWNWYDISKQSAATIMRTQWYVRNDTLHNDLQIPTWRQRVLTWTDEPLLVIVFTLATNSAERTETVYRAHCKALYLQKHSIEPVANGVMVEVMALKLTGCRFDS